MNSFQKVLQEIETFSEDGKLLQIIFSFILLLIKCRQNGPETDPINKIQRWIYAGIRPIREATIGHVTDVIGLFQRSVNSK